MLTRLLVCAAMATARLGELALSRRNVEQAEAVEEDALNRAIYPLIVGLHAVTIVATLLFGRRRSGFWLLVLLSMQPLRAWVLLTLRGRWNARGAVPDELEVETGGPYAYVRHPNYLVVLVELLALPMAFGLRGLAFLATLCNAALLGVRIRGEEAVLMERPGYREHFADKKRVIPGVF